jgi:hypothetical protein
VYLKMVVFPKLVAAVSRWATFARTCPYVHSHFAVGWVHVVALNSCLDATG